MLCTTLTVFDLVCPIFFAFLKVRLILQRSIFIGMFLYKDAASVISLIDSKKASIKTAVAESKYKNKKQLQALVLETLKYRDVITKILSATPACKKEKLLKDHHLALVLLYDFLLGKGILHAGKYKEALLRHKNALQSELARIKVKAKVSANVDLIAQKISGEEILPRYVRVNTLRTSVEDVVEHFRREDYTKVSCHTLSYQRYVEYVSELKEKQFFVDPHVPTLLVFAPSADFHDHVLYTTGQIILQDKASCLPAQVLAPPPGSHVIDACAAPGNKTTHLTALMKNKGKVFAFDKDVKRVSTLNMMTLKAGSSCAIIRHQDFLSVRTDDARYSQVEYILVDPSCSGSGIVSRHNSITDIEEPQSDGRLEKLACFQATVVKHALSFPSVKRLVYSTCSIHQRENEDVVEDVLGQVKNSFEIIDILPQFPHRGKGNFSEASKCVRMSSKLDKTNGFFLACFQRKQSCCEEMQPCYKEEKPSLSVKTSESAEHSKIRIDSNQESNEKEKMESSSKAKLKKKKMSKLKEVPKTPVASSSFKNDKTKKKKRNRQKHHRPVTA